MNDIDTKHNFFAAGIIPDRNYRFVIARNTAVAQEIGARHGASPQITALFGETVLGAFFLAVHSSKEENLTISLQMECTGPANKVFAFASKNGGVRAYGSNPDAVWSGGLYAGKLSGALTVNRWREDQKKKVYTSTVEMRNVPLDKNLEEFMGRSEQTQSFSGIESTFADTNVDRISGYMFQAMPGATAEDHDAVLELIQHRTADSMIGSLVDENSGSTRSERLTGQIESVKILRMGSFFLHCDCSREKIENTLVLLGEDEVTQVLKEEGQVEVHCEFCKKRYNFTQKDVTDLFIERAGS